MSSLRFLPLLVLASACSPQPEAVLLPHQEVDPFIGTGGHGHTYPGASSPFGMVQLSPDTRIDGWDGCGGYHHSDSVIYGFSHTHLQGTGVSDYGDILMMPCTQFKAGKSQWRDRIGSSFTHAREFATAGHYAVHLDDHALTVELTTTPRTGIQHVVLDQPDTLTVVIDMAHRDELLQYSIYPLDDSTLVGHRVSTNWAREQHVYFATRFSKPFVWRDQLTELTTTALDDGRLEQVMEYVPVFAADFGVVDSLTVRTGLSFVDIEGALANLQTEAPHTSFDAYVTENHQRWDEQLGRIAVEGGSKADRTRFYTALYHSCTAPNLASDCDGRYRGTDLQIHSLAPGEGQHYTVFSLWDTFRALHPLLNWIEPERTRDFARTFLRMYEQGGQLPVWELAGNYTGCMIGYHSVPVLADAWRWGIQDFDASLALEAMVQAADSAHLGLPAYQTFGFIPSDVEHESVSKTLEYAFDDACIAAFAEATGADAELVDRFRRRSCAWRNLYNPATGFIQPKRGGAFVEGFDPREVNFNYTEANGWQYTFFMPHDLGTFEDWVGGDTALVAFLDRMFEAPEATTGREQADITGLIGQYAHGNEPSHHMAYLYTFAGRPDRTADYVDRILNELYTTAPDGLSGNEDCGQMSAWYVWSALGLYPVAPASGQITLGTPRFQSVHVRPNGRPEFTLRRTGPGRYMQRTVLNGRDHLAMWLSVDQLAAGGTFEVTCGTNPSVLNGWDRPRTEVNCPDFVPVPIIEAPRTFRDSATINLRHTDAGARLHYRFAPDDPWTVYTGPVTVTSGCTMEAQALAGSASSPVVAQAIRRVQHNWALRIVNGEFSHQYHAGGADALIDGISGGPNFKTGEWQGYFGQDLVAEVDLGTLQRVRNQSIGALRDIRPWIMLPSKVQFLSSADGVQWTPVGGSVHLAREGALSGSVGGASQDAGHTLSDRDEEPVVIRFGTNTPVTARYLRLEVRGYGPLKPPHLGAGNPSWLFVDEWEIDVEALP